MVTIVGIMQDYEGRHIQVRSKVEHRSGRRVIAAASGLLAAGFILGAGTAGVSARPSVVLEQSAPSAPAPGDLVGPGAGFERVRVG